MDEEKTNAEVQVQTEEEPEGGSENNDTKKEPVKFYKDLVKQAQEVAHADDWKKAEQQLDVLSHRWSDGPKASGQEQEEKIKDLFYKFTKAAESFEDKKEQKIKESKQQRGQNLTRKKQLLEELQEIVNKKRWKARGRVRNIEKEWNSFGEVPNENKEELQQEFNTLIKEFKSHKVDQIV